MEISARSYGTSVHEIKFKLDKEAASAGASTSSHSAAAA